MNNVPNMAMKALRMDSIFPLLLTCRQPGDLGVLRGVIHGFSEEARTLGFASLTLVRFAFIVCSWNLCAY
jgi:hypothetical protein